MRTSFVAPTSIGNQSKQKGVLIGAVGFPKQKQKQKQKINGPDRDLTGGW